MKKGIDVKSFLLGCLTVLVLATTIAAGTDYFNSDEAAKLKILAGYVQPDGSLNLGSKKITMLGSSIYDDGSEGGGLQIRGGANRIHFFGQPLNH
jgi:hypothetical protein